MIVGVGIDVVEVSRLAESLERTPNLRQRVFTPLEAGLSISSLAGRFAAKEALAKALSTDGSMEWTDAGVITDEHGVPSFELTGTVAARVEALGVSRVHLSISHDGGIASAVVIAERD